MEQTLNHFENAAFSATACDMEGIIVYQNALSIKRKGDVRGKSVVSSSRWRDVGTLGNHHRLARGLSYIR